jgi:hypothetical protein
VKNAKLKIVCRLFLRSLPAIFFFFQLHCAVYAQLNTYAQEIWPSLDVYYRFNEKYRLYGTFSGTKQESNYAEGTTGIFVDYFTKPLKMMEQLVPSRNDSLSDQFLWIRAGYQLSQKPPNAKDPFNEHTLVTEINGRVVIRYNILLTLKNRFDWRMHNGIFSVRYRPRLQFEKDMKTTFLTFRPSIWGEYFANIDNGTVNKFRIQAGVEFRVIRIMNYEVYWNHQFSNLPEVNDLDAMGMRLKFYLNRKRKKEKQ